MLGFSFPFFEVPIDRDTSRFGKMRCFSLRPFLSTSPYRNWWRIVNRQQSQSASAWQVLPAKCPKVTFSLASLLVVSHHFSLLLIDSDPEQSGHWQSDVNNLSRWSTFTRFVETYVVWNAKSRYWSRVLHYENSILLFSFRARRIGDCASHRYQSISSLRTDDISIHSHQCRYSDFFLRSLT